MIDEQKRLVQESFKQVEPISDAAASLFYARLFELDPSLQPGLAQRVEASPGIGRRASGLGAGLVRRVAGFRGPGAGRLRSESRAAAQRVRCQGCRGRSGSPDARLPRLGAWAVEFRAHRCPAGCGPRIPPRRSAPRLLCG